MQTSKDFLHIFLDMGDALLNSGAEIFRVEDTLNRMGYACGAAQMNVFVITSSIVITMEFPEEGARTQTRRIRESGGNDFTKLEQLNDLSRRFCNHPVPAAELRKEFDKINKLLDIRFRKPQDDIVVSNDGSTKKLKKELVDRKIPSAYRDNVLLVCDKNHVLWACGVRRCESCLVDDETSCVLQILINMKERN